MEGERKRRGDGLGLMLALIRDSFFFRLSAALGNAIQRGARESLLVRWLTTAPKQPRGGLCHELLVTRPAAMVKRLRQWLAAQVENSFLLRLWRAVVRHLLSLATASFTRCAPKEPPKESITGLSSKPKALRASSRDTLSNSVLIGLPVIIGSFLSFKYFLASGIASITASAPGANILVVIPGKAFCS